ncbi:PREDICTED: m7GpppN-mRNA hydrolase-like, partial [Priapulus caudatus]|uniref:M7GpppN-mRNA hydrolase-like n=1 Tax=Priapulus caudatus TaxID=37621 RepID=A0ABM1ET67_PRICU
MQAHEDSKIASPGPGSSSFPKSSTSTPSFRIPTDILDDLCSRFIINIPEEERQDLIRVCFQVELAHWFYIDFYCPDNANLRSVGMKEFTAQVFGHCSFLMEEEERSVERILDEWREYKMAVPTYGAIMLDTAMESVLLVQGFWSKVSWGFPKGKVNEEESATRCAAREVLEETGFDVDALINDDDYVEYALNGQTIRLYIVTGVPLDAEFAPRTRNEIRALQWFAIADLPAHKKDTAAARGAGGGVGLNPNSFFMVIPFVKPLRRWISNQLGKGGDGQQTGRQRSRTLDDTDRQKQKQRQYFAQQNQNALNESQTLRNARHTASSPRSRGRGTRGTRERHESIKEHKEDRCSPVSATKQKKEVSRDSAAGGGSAE